MGKYETREVIFTCICMYNIGEISQGNLFTETECLLKLTECSETGNISEWMFNDGRAFSKKPQKDRRSGKDA